MNQVQEGIYLETKQTQVGTGHTASRVTFKNHYALRLAGEEAVLFLLDDNLGLTGLRESVPLAQVGKRLEYQPDLQDTFAALLPRLGSRPQPAARPASAPAQSAPAAAPAAVQTVNPAQPPQARPTAQPPQARPTPPPPQTRPAAAPPAKPAAPGDTPWWELTQKGASNLLKKD
ncbi:MAG: hypothetical protein HY910_04390 [Desulfarculus sp.]|nr:hypothetical protein [Desulfarculus sp.]